MQVNHSSKGTTAYCRGSSKSLEEKNESCAIALKVQSNKSVWYANNGCSTNMTRDKKKIVSLQEDSNGTISFENDGSAKVIGKGIVKLGSKKSTVKDVLLIEDLNHNLLSVSQMCYQGHKLLFDSKKCEIRREK